MNMELIQKFSFSKFLFKFCIIFSLIDFLIRISSTIHCTIFTKAHAYVICMYMCNVEMYVNAIWWARWVRYAQTTMWTSLPCGIVLSRNQRKILPTLATKELLYYSKQRRRNRGDEWANTRLSSSRTDNKNDEYRDVWNKHRSRIVWN